MSEDLSGAGGLAEPGGHDHRRPVELLAVGQRLAGVEPDAQLHTAGGHAQGALHVDGAADRTHCAGEREHEALAGRSDLASAVLGRRPPQLGEALTAHGIRRLVAPALEQRGRSDEVCEQDRDE